MKYRILTKRNLISILICFTIGLLVSIIGLTSISKAVTTATTDRVIPIYCVDKEEKVCAISFDAAWGNEQTSTLLDILDQYKVKTTFFLVGQWVDNYPDSVKEIAKRGHDIGNHSSTHAYMTQISTDQMQTEIKECNEKIEAITGKCPTLFRPPYGDYNNDVVNCVNGLGMYCIQWNIDSLDWKDPSVDQIVQNCVSKLEPGSIILLHNGATNTPEALPKVIEAIQAKGYELVPISELLPEGEYETDHEGRMNIIEVQTEIATE